MSSEKEPISVPICYAFASYGVAVTSAFFACLVWLSLFTIAPGTTVRPFGQLGASVMIGGMGTLVALSLSASSLVFGRERVSTIAIGIIASIIALAPIPISNIFFDWVMQTQGLIPAE